MKIEVSKTQFEDELSYYYNEIRNHQEDVVFLANYQLRQCFYLWTLHYRIELKSRLSNLYYTLLHLAHQIRQYTQTLFMLYHI